MDWLHSVFDSHYLWVFGAVVVLGTIGAIVRHRKEKQLTAELQRLAQLRGWNYVHRDNSYLHRFTGGPPFGRGRARKVKHVLHGPYRNQHVTVFQYEYTEGSRNSDSNNESTWYFMVAGVDLPAPRPLLELTREGVGSKVLGFFGKRDLQLESGEFNERFRIRTDNDRFAYDILHPRMMQWMLADARANEWPFRFTGAQLMSWRRGRANPQQMLQLVDFVCDVAETVPDFVWRR